MAGGTDGELGDDKDVVVVVAVAGVEEVEGAGEELVRGFLSASLEGDVARLTRSPKGEEEARPAAGAGLGLASSVALFTGAPGLATRGPNGEAAFFSSPSPAAPSPFDDADDDGDPWTALPLPPSPPLPRPRFAHGTF